MCGLIYLRRKDGLPAAKAVIKRYNKQKGRGQEGFGYVAIKDNKVVSYKRARFWDEIQYLLTQEDAPEILFHHRFPTSTANIIECAHPIYVSNEKLSNDYYIVHNGVIRNTGVLKYEHEEQGFVYNTEINSYVETKNGNRYEEGVAWNDSESLAIETALVIDGLKNEIDTIGPAAVIGLKVDADSNVLERFFYRNYANPMTHYDDVTMTVLSSEGKGESVMGTSIHVLNESGGFTQYTDLKPPIAFEPTPKYNYHRDDDYGGHMGFGKTYALPEKNEKHPPIEIYTDQDIGMMSVKDLISGDAATSKFLEGMIESWDEIKKMSEDELWGALDITIGDLDEVEKELAEFDENIEGYPASSDDYVRREEIISRKRKATAQMNQYEHALNIIQSTKEGTSAMKF